MVGLLSPLLHRGYNFVWYSTLPFASIKPNPLLDYELKRHGFGYATISGQIPSGLKTFISQIGFVFPACLSLAAMCCLCASAPISRTLNTSPLITVAFYLAVGYSIFVNLYYVLLPIHSVGSQINSPEWDTVRVTMLSSDDIVLTKYTIGLLRVWKATAIETGIRTFVAIPLLLATVFISLYTRDLRTVPFTWLSFAFPVFVFVLEPFWRTRAVAALGIAIAAQFTNATYAILAAFGAVVAFLITLAAILIGVLRVVDQLAYRTKILYDNRALVQLVVFLGGTFVLYAFYKLIAIVSLRRASALIARSE